MDAQPRLVSRRTALQVAAIVAVTSISNAAESPASSAKPKSRDCVWIPTTGDQFCCGMVHRPAVIQGKTPAALIVHDVAGSKDQPHRILVELAEALAAAGVIAVRIDLRGRGDSEGECVDATPARDLEDVRAALAAVAKLPDVDPADVTAIGLGYGGALVSQVAGETTAVKRVVLIACCPTDNENWSPTVSELNGRQVWDQFGTLLSKEFFQGFHELTPLSQLKKNRQPTFLVYGAQDQMIRQDSFETCKSELSFSDVEVKFAKIDGADHALSSAVFQQQAIGKTIEWLKQQA